MMDQTQNVQPNAEALPQGGLKLSQPYAWERGAYFFGYYYFLVPRARSLHAPGRKG
jgi:hypothetical protein